MLKTELLSLVLLGPRLGVAERAHCGFPPNFRKSRIKPRPDIAKYFGPPSEPSCRAVKDQKYTKGAGFSLLVSCDSLCPRSLELFTSPQVKIPPTASVCRIHE